jgi:hypothetical protein
MTILSNGHQNRFRKLLPVIVGRINSSYCTILDSINEAVIDKVQGRKRKYDELATFLYKYYVAAAAEKNLAIVRGYMSQDFEAAVLLHGH